MDSMSCYRKWSANPAMSLAAIVFGVFAVEEARTGFNKTVIRFIKSNPFNKVVFGEQLRN